MCQAISGESRNSGVVQPAGPVDVSPASPRTTFSSLGIRDYRVYAAGALVANAGTWMGRIAEDWLVLTDLTDRSALALGVVTGLQALPLLFVSPWGGLLVDRWPARGVLMGTHLALLVTSAILGVLVLHQAAQLWQVCLLAFINGIVIALGAPAAYSLVAELVPRTQLANAVALNSAGFHLGRLVGPGLAGTLIATVGLAPTFFLHAVTSAVLIGSLALVHTHRPASSESLRMRGGIRRGLVAVGQSRQMTTVLLLVAVLGTFGMNFQVTMALMVTHVFERGPQDFGLLGTMFAVGSVLGALFSARRPLPRLRRLLAALLIFALANLCLALSPGYVVFAALLVPTGWAALVSLTTANALVQLAAPPAVRGRVMALYVVALIGGTPLISPSVGLISDVVGVRWAIAMGSVAVGLSLTWTCLRIARTQSVWLNVQLRRRPMLTVSLQPIEEAIQQGPAFTDRRSTEPAEESRRLPRVRTRGQAPGSGVALRSPRCRV